ncbi:hypothetical protein GCM10009000_040820 [Halobacterium noricense]|uniref:Uncharacterized protein n=1 Tax=Haladaptatus pallidirubidus TaxID=1008152 RepID=A0AAV3UGH8_9EURY
MPFAVESLANCVEDGATASVETEFELLAAFDAHGRQTAVTRISDDAGTAGDAVLPATAETGDAPFRPRERAVAVRTGADRNPGF